jgi:Coenzyme PQQ synthesis protein D (PqqD)
MPLTMDRARVAPQQTWVHSPDAAWVDSGQRVMALDVGRAGARPRSLEGVAAVIWRALDAPRSIDALVDQLAVDFDGADPEEMRGDVARFLSDLGAAHLVTTAEG